MRAFVVVILAVVALAASACQSVADQVVSDLQFAEKAWEEDKRPTADDESYAQMSVAERENYIPESLDHARRRFFAQAISTARAGAGQDAEAAAPDSSEPPSD